MSTAGEYNFHIVSKYWKKKVLNRDKSAKTINQKEVLVTKTVAKTDLFYFNQLTNNNLLAQHTVLTAIYSFLLKRLIADYDGYVVSKFENQENALLLSLSVDLKLIFKEFLQKAKVEILESLNHSADYYKNRTDSDSGIDLAAFSNFGININSQNNLDCRGILLNVAMSEGETIEFQFRYLDGFVKKEIIDYLIQHFTYFIVNLESCLSCDLSEYPLLTEEDKQQLLVSFNNTDVSYPQNKTIVDLFEEQVVKTPDNIAVLFENSVLTYSDINKKANQLAHYLSSNQFVGKGDIVGVFLPKADSSVVSLLAILKLGAVYMPIDINYPQERIDYLIKDSGLKIVISDNSFTIDNCNTIDLNSINFEGIIADNINTKISAEDLAYIIYTSGSTGQPKGVAIKHTSNVNMSLDQIRKFNISESDKVVWFASVAFDASISEIMMCLYSGAALCIPTDEIIKDKYKFIGFLKKTKATVVTFPPSYLALLDENDISGLRCIITAGESANPSKALAVIRAGIDYYNAYGPTECAVCVSIYKVTVLNAYSTIIPIGKPISNTSLYILDEDFKLVPIGVTGKIFVAGVGLAQGYLNKNKLTAEKFIDNPFSTGDLMYDTGDLGCWLSDGNIEFLGRKDDQVKIRGYRIELGEIENTILKFSDDLKHAVVEVRENNNEKILVAYFVAVSNIEKTALKKFLKEMLPDYMVPAFLMELDSLPLTPNGKINRKALPDVSGKDAIREEYVAPRNKMEEVLVAIWQEVLQVEKIGVNDDFFDLGGHSLMVAQVINRIYKQLGNTINFKSFFENPSVYGISRELGENKYISIPKAPAAAFYPLTPSQTRVWILSQLEGGSLAYNMPATIKLKGFVDVNKLEEAFVKLIAHHEILRTCFKSNKNGEISQFIRPFEETDFKITHYSFPAGDNQEQEVEACLNTLNTELFDLEQGPLIRASLLKLNEEEYVFFLSLHHIIGDGWSIEILTSEIVGTYNKLSHGKEADLPEMSIQYKDYAVWLSLQNQSERYLASEQYWLEQFKEEVSVLDLPSFKQRPLIKTYNGSSLTYCFSNVFLNRLKDFSKKQDVTLFMTLITGINALLHKYSGQNDIVVGIPIAGREHPDLENQMGLYLNTLPIRTQFEEDNTFLDLIIVQKETLSRAYDHQNYPFDALVGKLNLKRDTSRSALFDVLVVLQNQGQLKNMNTEELSNIEISSYDFNTKTSQLDLSFTFVESDELNLKIEYNTDIYDEYLIERMFIHFENLITELIVKPEKSIKEIDYLTNKEKEQLLVNFNNTEVFYSKNKTIIDSFEEQVIKTPDNIAVVFNESVLTYEELNIKANQLAYFLRKNYEIESDDLIGIALERSEMMIVAILGVLKSGAAYVPIDINYPKDRIEYIRKDSNCKIVIDNSVLEEIGRFKDKSAEKNLTVVNGPDDLAYVIYTSGTTGNPKGVMVRHSSLTNYVSTFLDYFQVNESDSILSQSTISFDTSIEEIFPILNVGGKLVIAEDNKDFTSVFSLCEKHEITILSTNPFLIDFLNTNSESGLFRSLKKIISGGDVLKFDYIDKIFDKTAVYNSYGPTETTVCATYCKIDKPSANIPIGAPIANAKIYILDDAKLLVPIAVPGRIFISGAGVAKGYLNKPELTSEKFIANSFVPGERMYDTGDLGYWLPDGTIKFLGRKDNQVKIRGHRIELGEIENIISQFSADLKQVVVEVKEINQEKVLVAYLVSTIPIDKIEIRDFLQGKLPIYMIPGFYISLKELHLTHNGKVDRKSLPNVDEKDIIRKEYTAPVNDVEKQLVIIWQEVLGLERIGTTDHFFELGGHSLLITKVINRIHEQLDRIVNFKTFYEHPTIEELSKKIFVKEYVAIPKAPELESYPLTPSQNRLWMLSQLEGGSLAYNMPSVVKLKGTMDRNKFEDSFRQLVERHEILRTSFKTNKDGEVNQYITSANDINFTIEQVNFSELEDKGQSLEEYLQERNSEAFNLEQAPLVRGVLIALNDNEWIFFLSLHHIIGDGWSVELLISEIVEIYNSLTTNKEASLPILKIQYKDYALWFNNELENDKLKNSENYWLKQFSGEIPVLDLPSFKTRPLLKTYNGSTITTDFSAVFLERIKDFSKENKATLFMVVMTAVKVLLNRYSGQNDIVIGTPIAGRDHSDLEGQMGLFANTLAIRTRFGKEDSFLSLLEKEKLLLLEAYEHQHYPFDALVNKINLKRDMSRSALFDVMVVLQNQYQKKELNSLEFVDYQFKSGSSKFDLTFTFVESEGLSLAINFNSDIYDSISIERMFNHFENLLIHSFDAPELPVSELIYLTEHERKQLLFDFNSRENDYQVDKTIVELFEEQAALSADKVAVVFDDVELTYQELNEQSNLLAHYLRENYEIKRDDLVGIKLERSEKSIITILGILKSGGAYVPIDPDYPQNRIEYIEKDSTCKIVIDKNEFEKFYKCKDHYSKTNLTPVNSLSDLVYVIYTSGTTGNPKGVMVENRNLTNYVFFQIRYLGLNSSERVPLMANISFDASVEQIFTTLLSSATLYVLKKEDLISVDRVREFLIKNSITHIHSVPSLLSKLNLNSLTNLKRIISAGEPFIREISRTYLGQYKLYNKYGPTETTISSLIGSIENIQDVSIGSPISNTQIYILDDSFQPVGLGINGKLYISGFGVARGYLNRPELTEEKFIPNPFVEGTMMYDTGDLGCWLPDGKIEFKGRRDHQVKIRGFRVELEEIENIALQYSEALVQFLVEAVDTAAGKVLVAYFVSDTAIDKSDLRSYLQNQLPDYMVPGFYVKLEALPLTPNGKIDRKALPVVAGEDLIKKEYIAPVGDIQEKLALIWQEVLGIQEIGVTDNFFELGGHSLIVGQVINRIYKQLNKSVTFKTFFSSPTIETLSKELQDQVYQAISKAPEAPSYPLTAAQGRIWILSQLEGGSLAYNMPAAVRLHGDVDLQKMKKCFTAIIASHEILRTRFKTSEEGEVRQHIASSDQTNFEIAEIDFSFEKNQDQVIADYLEQLNNEPFDLEHGPLIRASLLKTASEHYIFFLSMHHIIGDGWSIELLLSEIIKNYNALRADQAINLPVLNIQYKDYAVWLNAEIQQEKHRESENYWLAQFAGEIPVLDLPSFNTRPLLKTYNGTSQTHTFSKAFLERLKTFSNAKEATLFMTLMAGIKILLYRYTGQSDLIIGTPIAGREHPDLENQLGLYLNILAVRTQFDDRNSFENVVNKEKNILLEAYEHQNYPFDVLISKLNLKRDAGRSALFDVLVVLQNQGQLKNLNNDKLNDLEVSQYDLHSNTSKFDISFTFVETEGLDLIIEYNTDIYDAFLITRMFSHFENIMSQSMEQPEIFIEDLDYLLPSEKEQLLVDFNDTKADYPRDKTIIDLFEKQIEASPDSIAVVFEKTKLTYRELNKQANELGHYLREMYSIEADDLVGVKLERSEKMIVVLLGILKSGGAYVPIDINYPEQRISYIQDNSNCKAVIDSAFLENFLAIRERFSDENPVKINKPSHLAYVIYTSGTTGNPKGVMVENRNVVNLITSQSIKFEINETDNISQFSNIAFDASVEQIFLALLNGACLSILSQDVLLDAKKLEVFLESAKITHFHAVPAVVEKITPKKYSFLRRIISGGDICSINTAKKWHNYCSFYNEYGPTETTVTSIETLYNNESSLSIGRPILNTQIYLLDKELNPVPIGVTGNLYIAGEGVSRGYLHNKELTKEKFIKNPLNPDSVMYETGDLGCWLADGNIKFLGRSDNQVKIRGFRIELGEIESMISKYSAQIQQSVVLVEEVNQEKVLVAFIGSEAEIDKLEIRHFLQDRLPDYMVPSFYVLMKELPVTPNGKIDRRNLPQISGADIIRKEYKAPKNEIEEKLVMIWQDVLGIEKIGTTDNFFEMGGHSLKATKLISLIQREFEIKLSIRDLFENIEIEDLALLIENISLTEYETELENKDYDKENDEIVTFQI
ncbi:non-ribosomal peptide synthetase [Flavobacterium sp. N502540]|uniref:non-ribosomal peptide synthetase n=1 Tax=Flavobacterium sp. N502540 TaxID=2986838 RepID=UPI002224A993|nr:non-ribosomal peptide synthetase [Flavobacterium sp. N502540]